MGLDISAYRQLKAAPDAKTEDGEPVEWDKHIKVSAEILAWVEKEWPGRSFPVLPGIYSFADSTGFRAGSYSGYGQWRDWLARATGYESARALWENNGPGPFVELINFADNEGIIGSEIAAKLAKDFANYAEKIAADAQPWEIDLYHKWREAFEMAADGGCVEFH